MKNFIVSILLLFVFSFSYAQNKKEILLTINEIPVYSSEFRRVFNKNLDLVKDDSQKSIDGYLDLFIDYKLKVAEAYAQNLDAEVSYTSEFNRYRDQLSRNYIFEDKVTNELTLEAYERGMDEISANHILVLVDYEAKPEDTLKAYNKIKSVYEMAKAGEDFETLAKKYSEEPKAKETAGKLGYFSVFSMVYPFETMAYNTKVGEVSEIVRTQFGYHIIKVNDRRNRLEQLTVSHIMISDNGEDRTFNPEERINELSALLEQGASFESLAKQYSDDKNSAKNGGKLQKFRKGDLRAIEFETAAYDLEKPGDISKPIKTRFGWHIIRLEERHTVASYEEEKESLTQKVKSGERSKIVNTALSNKIKEKYNYKKVTDHTAFFDTYVSDDVLKRRWEYDTIPASQDKVLFTIGDKELYFNDFARFIKGRQNSGSTYKQKKNMLASFYDEFETAELRTFFKENLEFENEEYAATINEYRSGLLIFDVMDKNIWKKSKNDSVGLQEFYNKNKTNYLWNDRVNATIYSSTANSTAEEILNLLQLNTTSEEIKKQLNTKDKINVIISEGIFEKGKRELPQDFDVVEGISRIYSKNNEFVVVNVDEIIPAGVKELSEVRGRVMSDYQNHLEKEWIEGLRQKYKVKINKRSLKKLKKEYKS